MAEFDAAILSIAYLPNIQYIAKLLHFKKVLIEQHENYQKQSYRNRCIIYSANGTLPLIIPVIKTSGNNTKIKDIQLDYATSWQRIHWHAIVSAYQSSPYFEFYRDEFEPFYQKKEKYLFDFNLKLFNMILSWLKIEPHFHLTTDYSKNPAKNEIDYRQSINPKQRLSKPDPYYKSIKYQQVFTEKHGFIQNLSIIDLLFNTGPESLTIIKESLSL